MDGCWTAGSLHSRPPSPTSKHRLDAGWSLRVRHAWADRPWRDAPTVARYRRTSWPSTTRVASIQRSGTAPSPRAADQSDFASDGHFRIEDGLAAEHWDTVDYVRLYQSFGLPPRRHQTMSSDEIDPNVATLAPVVPLRHGFRTAECATRVQVRRSCEVSPRLTSAMAAFSPTTND